jgi:hypothetical protein
MGEHARMGVRPHEGRPGSLGELIHRAVRRAIEVAVDKELTAALGARPYERGGDRGRSPTAFAQDRWDLGPAIEPAQPDGYGRNRVFLAFMPRAMLSPLDRTWRSG